ncbi:MAG: hypothetical protein EZS28_018695 [Streblomastix strix]|uniref:Uncharacterized protein n=1 Tax=Streblomastix strix TaxID=222440 RepID=A0A5J4VT29_9EUKA|nr:MAG: hypothetical protein EZS28_018695 [Streblomastix strix]
MNDNLSLSILTPSEIGSLFIQILALLDFYHRHTSQKEEQQSNQKQISVWLEVRLLILSHSLVLQLHRYQQSNESYEIKNQEHCNVINAVIFIEDLLAICEINSEENIKEELMHIISKIKEKDKKGEIIQFNKQLEYRVKEEMQISEQQENKNDYNRVVQCWGKYDEFLLEIIDLDEKENDISKAKSKDTMIQIQAVSQKDFPTSSSESVDAQIKFRQKGFSRIYKINPEFCMINAIVMLDQDKEELITDEALLDDNDYQPEVNGVIQAIGDILMNEQEKNAIEAEQYNWACEAAIPFLGQIVKNWAERYERQKQIQIRKFEKQSFSILAHIATKGVYYQKEAQRAINTLYLLLAFIKEQQIQFNPEIIEVDLAVFFKWLVSKSRFYSQSSTTSEAIRKFCIDTFYLVNNKPYGNVPSFVHNSKLMQVQSLWMCNAGGEEQNDRKISETMDRLMMYEQDYALHRINEEKDIFNMPKLKRKDLLVPGDFEEQMIEEGIKEEYEAHIFSQKLHIKLQSLRMKIQLMQFQERY